MSGSELCIYLYCAFGATFVWLLCRRPKQTHDETTEFANRVEALRRVSR